MLGSMPDFVPLGSLSAFSEWNSPRPWGPDGAWSVTFGNGEGVVDSLVAGLFAHQDVVRAQRRSWRSEPFGVVLGCTPWLTSMRIADALATMCSCVVIDKQLRHGGAIRHLARTGNGIELGLLGLGDWGPLDEPGRPIVDPYGPEPGSRELEPVRMVGFDSANSPLLHAKLAVCCAAWQSSDEPEVDNLDPLSVWMGSANWTDAASDHIEFGAWSRDRLLCEAALQFMTAVVRASEPLTSTAPGPLPELAPVEYGALYDKALAATQLEAENDMRAWQIEDEERRRDHYRGRDDEDIGDEEESYYSYYYDDDESDDA
jgi:hypothetical protein